jgi:hypothetical protein
MDALVASPFPPFPSGITVPHDVQKQGQPDSPLCRCVYTGNPIARASSVKTKIDMRMDEPDSIFIQ